MRLTTWARTVIGRPFVWGETDCGSLVRAALTLRGIAVDAPHYTTIAGAQKCWEATAGGVVGVMESLGAKKLDARYTTVGDVVTARGDRFPAALVNVDGRLLESDVREGVRWHRGPLPENAVTWRLDG